MALQLKTVGSEVLTRNSIAVAAHGRLQPSDPAAALDPCRSTSRDHGVSFQVITATRQALLAGPHRSKQTYIRLLDWSLYDGESTDAVLSISYNLRPHVGRFNGEANHRNWWNIEDHRNVYVVRLDSGDV